MAVVCATFGSEHIVVFIFVVEMRAFWAGTTIVWERAIVDQLDVGGGGARIEINGKLVDAPDAVNVVVNALVREVGFVCHRVYKKVGVYSPGFSPIRCQ